MRKTEKEETIVETAREGKKKIAQAFLGTDAPRNPVFRSFMKSLWPKMWWELLSQQTNKQKKVLSGKKNVKLMLLLWFWWKGKKQFWVSFEIWEYNNKEEVELTNTST